MLRKSVIALAAAFAIGSAFVATDASARSGGWQGGHGGHGGWHGGGMKGGFAGGFHRGGHFRGGHFGFRRHHFGPGFAFAGAGLWPYYAYDSGCWRLRRAWTPWGWQWRRVYVCY